MAAAAVDLQDTGMVPNIDDDVNRVDQKLLDKLNTVFKVKIGPLEKTDTDPGLKKKILSEDKFLDYAMSKFMPVSH